MKALFFLLSWIGSSIWTGALGSEIEKVITEYQEGIRGLQKSYYRACAAALRESDAVVVAELGDSKQVSEVEEIELVSKAVSTSDLPHLIFSPENDQYFEVKRTFVLKEREHLRLVESLEAHSKNSHLNVSLNFRPSFAVVFFRMDEESYRVFVDQSRGQVAIEFPGGKNETGLFSSKNKDVDLSDQKE